MRKELGHIHIMITAQLLPALAPALGLLLQAGVRAAVWSNAAAGSSHHPIILTLLGQGQDLEK